MSEKEKYQNKPHVEEVVDSDSSNLNYLVLHNDDVHTFDYVIEALIEVCEHDIVQAEQCTYLVHYRGKCEVKKGSKNFLTPMRRKLAQLGLKATIDQ